MLTSRLSNPASRISQLASPIPYPALRQNGVVFAATALALLSLSLAPASAQSTHAGHGSSSDHDESPSSVDHWLPRLEDPDRDEWQKPAHVVALLAISEGMNVVDLGAGTGYFLGYLARAVGENGSVLGLDVDRDLVDSMNLRAEMEGWSNVDARVVATDDPGLPPQSVDRILIVNTWHHLDDRGSYARRLASALKPGGAVYVVDLTMDSPHGPSAKHRLSPEEVQKELAVGGLKTHLIDEDLPYQYVVMATQ